MRLIMTYQDFGDLFSIQFAVSHRSLYIESGNGSESNTSRVTALAGD